MEPTLIAALMQMVNREDFKTAIEHYVSYRTEALRRTLETANDMNTVCRVQGQITELKRLLSLREQLLAETKKDK